MARRYQPPSRASSGWALPRWRVACFGRPVSYRVLVVDDEPGMRHMLAEVIGGMGHAVVTAADGAEALERLRYAEELPCAILIDMTMPHMDGRQLAAALRSDPAWSKIPFALIGTNPAHEREASALGARSWLAKPIDVDRLMSALKDLCGILA